MWTLKIKYLSIYRNLVFSGLYLLNGAYYNHNLHERHIESHIYAFQLTSSFTLNDLCPWMTFNGQIEVIEFLVGCIS